MVNGFPFSEKCRACWPTHVHVMMFHVPEAAVSDDWQSGGTTFCVNVILFKSLLLMLFLTLPITRLSLQSPGLKETVFLSLGSVNVWWNPPQETLLSHQYEGRMECAVSYSLTLRRIIGIFQHWSCWSWLADIILPNRISEGYSKDPIWRIFEDPIQTHLEVYLPRKLFAIFSVFVCNWNLWAGP